MVCRCVWYGGGQRVHYTWLDLLPAIKEKLELVALRRLQLRILAVWHLQSCCKAVCSLVLGRRLNGILLKGKELNVHKTNISFCLFRERGHKKGTRRKQTEKKIQKRQTGKKTQQLKCKLRSTLGKKTGQNITNYITIFFTFHYIQNLKYILKQSEIHKMTVL